MALTRARFKVPLKVRFGGVGHREGWLYHGPCGWAEASPFPGFRPEQEQVCHRTAAALAIRPWPSPRADRIRVSSVVGAEPPEKAAFLAGRFRCPVVKVKVGDAEDEARVAAVRDAIGPTGELRIDANGRWDVDTAVVRIAALARYDIALVEQPVATIAEMAELRRRVDVPLAADECVSSVEDAAALKDAAAADAVVIKLQYTGGLEEATRIIDACGMPHIISSPVETSVGIAVGAHFAAALDPSPYAHALGTGMLLAIDVTHDRLLPEDGWLQVRRVEPDPDSLYGLEEVDVKNGEIVAANDAGSSR